MCGVIKTLKHNDRTIKSTHKIKSPNEIYMVHVFFCIVLEIRLLS